MKWVTARSSGRGRVNSIHAALSFDACGESFDPLQPADADDFLQARR